MRLEMKRVTFSPKSFNFCASGMHLEGHVRRVGSRLYLLEGKLYGLLSVQCASSGDVFDKPIMQQVRLVISDGIYTPPKSKDFIYLESGLLIESMDVVESFDGYVDIAALLDSEVQSIQADYHYQADQQAMYETQT